MHSQADWAQAAQQFQQTLGDGWTRAWAQAIKPIQGLDLGTTASPAALPKISFSPTKLQELQQQYLQESAALWNQSVDAAAIRKDRRFSAEAWTENPLTTYTAAAYLLTTQPQSWAVRKGAVWWLRGREREGQLQVVLHAVVSPELV